MTGKKGFYQRFVKRPQDLILSCVALVLLSPVLLAIALLVRVKLGRPVIFKQERPGLGGKIFVLYKFRSMTDKKDASGALLPDDRRLTRFGKALRASSLDELPELWNIIKGDMAIVGPRPLLVSYLPLYNARQGRRHEVRPGLTGAAQVNGRNAITWADKFEWDVAYVDDVRFLTDWRIMMKTVATVSRRKGVHGAAEATVTPFQGTDDC